MRYTYFKNFNFKVWITSLHNIIYLICGENWVSLIIFLYSVWCKSHLIITLIYHIHTLFLYEKVNLVFRDVLLLARSINLCQCYNFLLKYPLPIFKHKFLDLERCKGCIDFTVMFLLSVNRVHTVDQDSGTLCNASKIKNFAQLNLNFSFL